MNAGTTLQIRRYSAGSTDAHGNAAETLGTAEDWNVYGIAPGANVEAGRGERDVSEIEWTIYAPTDNLPSERDRVLVDGDEYAIEGRPADWSRGPFATKAGAVIELRRAEG